MTEIVTKLDVADVTVTDTGEMILDAVVETDVVRDIDCEVTVGPVETEDEEQSLSEYTASSE